MNVQKNRKIQILRFGLLLMSFSLCLSMIITAYGISNALKGDVNGDNQRNIVDVRLLLQKVINNSYSNDEIPVLDYNEDGEVSILDVRTLLQALINGIAPEDPVAPTAKVGLSYNGNAQELLNAGSTGVTWYYNIGTELTSDNYSTIGSTNIPTRISVGNYTIYYYTPGTDDYNSKSGSVVSTLGVKVINVNWSNSTSFIYNGSTQVPIASAVSGVEGETLNLSVTTSPTPAINVGSYNAQVTISSVTGGQANKNFYKLKDDTTSKAFTITKATPTAPTTKTGLSYKGTAQALVNAGSTGVTWYYCIGTELTSSNYSTTGSTSIPSKINVGNYTVYYYTPGNTNYNSKSGSFVATLGVKVITVNWGTTTTFTYNGSEQAPTASATSGVTGETINITRTTNVNAGSYTSTASISSVTGGQAYSGNYKLTGNTKAYTINKKAIQYSISNNSSTYDGQSHTFSLVPSEPTSSWSIYYSTETQLTSSNYNTAGSTTKPTRTNAGTTTVYWYIHTSNTNYSDVSGTATISINKKAIQYSTSNNSSTYDGQSHTFSLVPSEPTSSWSIYYSTETQLTSSNYSTAGSTTKPTRTNAGTTTVYWYIHTSNTNYSDVSGTATISINKKAIQFTSSNYSGAYDGNAHTFSLVPTEPTSSYTILYSTVTTLTSSNYSTAGSTTKPTRTDAGTTTVYWYIHTSNTNYSDISGNNKIEISSVAVTGVSLNNSNVILVTGQSGKYQETLTATVSPTNASNNTITWTSSNTNVATVSTSGQVVAKGVGTATITAQSNNGKTATANVKVYSNTTNVVDTYYDTDSYIISNYNVLAYGADPYGVNDSTTAFKNALSAANSSVNGSGHPGNGGGTVFVPKGKYKITGQLTLQTGVQLIGDLEEGTSNGTILMIDYKKGDTSVGNAAIKMNIFSSIRNIAFWYPEQSLDGSWVKYPPTISQIGTGITLENLTFINPYIAMDFAESSNEELNAIQYIRNVYGTPLKTGMINNSNLDTIKIENLNFSSKYWLQSSVSGKPSESTLSTALKQSGTVGIIFERTDWFFVTNTNIDGYYQGMLLRSSTDKGFEMSGDKTGTSLGEAYELNITNCFYPLYIKKSKQVAFTRCTFTASGGNDATAVYIAKHSTNYYTNVSFNSCKITSSGTNAIYNGPLNNISITNTEVKGKIDRDKDSSKITFINDTLSGTGFDSGNASENTAVSISNTLEYNKRVAKKPSSNSLVIIEADQNSDITEKLKDAINSLKTTGGTVYIPVGEYVVSGHIDVPSGIEIRGATSWAHSRSYIKTTNISTEYSGDVLFTLSGNSGINGLSISYPKNYNSSTVITYPYTIRGNGSNIYIVNVDFFCSSKGIDLYTNRCDKHLVERAYGVFFNSGIKVGNNSTNGIIRECHFTINPIRTAANLFTGISNLRKMVSANAIVFDIGTSSKELLVNNFVFGPKIGYNFTDGAQNFVFLANGCDNGRNPVHVSGSVRGEIINPMLVSTPKTSKYCDTYATNYYVKTESSFSGYINFINILLWGNDDAKGCILAGTGNIHFYGGIIGDKGVDTILSKPVLEISNKSFSMFGVIINRKDSVAEISLIDGFQNAGFFSNICLDGETITVDNSTSNGFTRRNNGVQ